MCGLMWGPIGRELVGVMFLVAFVLCTGSGLLGTSIAFNALSENAACTVWFSFVSMILVIMFSCIRTWDRMTWPMTLAFASVMGGVLAVVVGVTLRDRPAAAPAVGDFELGFFIVRSPSFAAGITATATIFIALAAGPAYLPIISEMKRPQDYGKAVIPVGVMVGSVYLAVSLVVYHYCGRWVATPSLGSAGPRIKKASSSQTQLILADRARLHTVLPYRAWLSAPGYSTMPHRSMCLCGCSEDLHISNRIHGSTGRPGLASMSYSARLLSCLHRPFQSSIISCRSRLLCALRRWRLYFPLSCGYMILVPRAGPTACVASCSGASTPLSPLSARS